MAETINIAVDTTDVPTAGTPVTLTSRTILCSSVYLIAAEGNAGANVYVVDNGDTSKKIRVPSAGITVPIGDPSLIFVDVDTSGDDVEWMAV